MQRHINHTDYLAPKYQKMVRGVNLTPEQGDTLRKLYERAMIPVKPWGYAFVGGLAANMVLCLCSLYEYEKNHNKEFFMWVMAAALAQFAGLVAVWYKKQKAENKLRDEIENIKKLNIR